MLAHQRGRVVAARRERREHLGSRASITERDRDVAQPALVADTMDGAAAHARAELLGAPGEQIRQPRRIESMADAKIRMRGSARKFVPRANELTVVAAIDPIA